MKIRTFTTITLIYFFSFISEGQTWNWAKSVGGTNGDYIVDMKTNPIDQSIVITGNVLDSAYFCNTIIPPNANRDIFVSKFANDGSCLWTKYEHSDSYTRGDGLAIDDAGNIYCCGLMIDTLRLGSITLLGHGSTDAFLAKYSSNGKLIWAKNFGGNGSDVAYDIEFHNGLLYLTGHTSDTAFFGSQQIVSHTSDFFIARLDTAGQVEQIQSFGSHGYDRAYQVDFKAPDKIMLCGFFSDTINIGSIQLISKGEKDIFLAEFDSNLNCTSAISWGGVYNDEPVDMVLDPSIGQSYVTYYYFSKSQIDSIQVDSSDSYNEALVCFDQNANYLWHKTLTSPASTYLSTIAIAPNGQIWYAAFLDSICHFDTLNIDGKDGSILFTKIAPDGQLLSHQVYNYPGMEVIWGMNYHAGLLNVFGEYSNTLSLAGTQTAVGGWDGFLAQMQTTFIGIENPLNMVELHAHPIPATSQIQIDIPKSFENADYEVFDISGQSLKQGHFASNPAIINISFLSPGMYILRSKNQIVKLIKI